MNWQYPDRTIVVNFLKNKGEIHPHYKKNRVIIELAAKHLGIPINNTKKKIRENLKFVANEIFLMENNPNFDTQKIAEVKASRILTQNYKVDNFKPSEDEIRKFYKTKQWQRLSYQIKLRYGRRCQCCGATPEDGARIITDHIEPIRKNWARRLDESNLQILCDDCNLGKASYDTTDFRENQ